MKDFEEDLRVEAKQKIAELYDSLGDKEKYCDRCLFLDVKPPFQGITTTDLNVWRDRYNATCEIFNKAWPSSKTKIPRLIECVVMGGKVTRKKFE